VQAGARDSQDGANEKKLMQARPTAYDFDGFATYATDPDGGLTRALEAFVEGFHRRKSIPDRLRRELELCGPAAA
jgi:hypothetical protein